MYTLTDKEVESLVKRAVDYGVSSWWKKDTLTLQIARFWLDGYIAGSNLTDDDTNHLYETLGNYYFKDEEE